MDEVNNGDGAGCWGPPRHCEFREDGTVSGSTGCNQFHGSYKVEGETIVIGPTRRRPGWPAGMTARWCSSATSSGRWQPHRVIIDAQGRLQLLDGSGAVQVGFSAGMIIVD